MQRIMKHRSAGFRSGALLAVVMSGCAESIPIDSGQGAMNPPVAGAGGTAAPGAGGTGTGPAGGSGTGGSGGSAGGATGGAARDASATRRPDARVVDAGPGPAAPRDAGGRDAGTANNRIVLFDGTSLAAWAGAGGGNPTWPIVDGAFEINPGSGDIRTRQRFGDMRLHLEFRIPRTPASNGEQDRGNSGVYLQGRYEIQILDSFDHPLGGANDCASIYGVKDADSNEATPPDTWQTFDIDFRAARFNGNTKVDNARVTVTWNGKVVQRDVEIPGPTGSGDNESAAAAPLRLQEHAHRVRFRNIWTSPLD